MNTAAPSHPPLTAATDAAALARLRALPPAEADALLDALDALPTPCARQDGLIGTHRLALSLAALAEWTRETRTARGERRFGEFLDDVRRAAERAEAFRDLLTRAERLHQVNVALLAARLFDALVARDGAAIETLAHTFAEVVAGVGRTENTGLDAAPGCRRPDHPSTALVPRCAQDDSV